MRARGLGGMFSASALVAEVLRRESDNGKSSATMMSECECALPPRAFGDESEHHPMIVR